MKQMKKLASLLLALVMIFALAATVVAQDVILTNSNDQGNGSITISNAAKGETYTLYRLFDAYISAIDETTGEAKSIVYTGEIPTNLTSYFVKDANGYIIATDAAWKDPTTMEDMSDGLRDALAAWAKNATAVAEETSDGTELVFKNLKYGYYVVGSSVGSAISVDSTNPAPTIVDKNAGGPSGLTKDVDHTDVNIGDTVTYTVKFKTSNYYGAGEEAKKVLSYTIKDTLPEFLSEAKVTSITVDNDGDDATTSDRINIIKQFDADKKIEIDWYDEANGTFFYDNGATITITYTAVVTDEAAIDGNGNENIVTLTWVCEGDTTTPPPEDRKLEDDETIYTYAIALKKVDKDGKPLAGAKFQFPFYVKETADAEDGAYIYAGTAAGDGLTNQIVTPDDGVIIVKGVAGGAYQITEVEAPAGYNKVANPISVTATKTGQTTTHTTIYLDADGSVVNQESSTITVEYENNSISTAVVAVLNKAGTLLPSTGGIGTTIFYVLGGILAAGAAIVLVTKRRMRVEK